MNTRLLAIMFTGFLAFGCTKAEQDKAQDSQEGAEQTQQIEDDKSSYGSLEDLGKKEEIKEESKSDDTELSPKEKQIKSMLDNPHEPPFMLMGGEKWDADEPTIKRIKDIHQMYKSFIANKRTDYNNFGVEVNKASIEVLEKCNMPEPHKGALYAWMAPIIGFSGMLKDVKNEELNARIVKKADEKMSEFDNFFK